MHRPRKRFGQHFLADPGVVDAIVAAVAPGPDDVLVEIGPGQGAITQPLAGRAGRLHAVEFDRDLVAGLRQHFAASERVRIHEADALSFNFAALGEDLRIVGNLPYNISTPLLFHLLTQRAAIRDMHFMLQKEVVERMAAAPGSRDFGRLTVMLGVSVRAEKLFDVPPGAFRPPPKVWSSVVRLSPLADALPDGPLRDTLAALVRQAFGQRRKTLRNALKGAAGPAEFAAAGIDPGARAEQLPVDAWLALARAVAELG